MREIGDDSDIYTLPVLPYNNSSGHSGTDTSRERAEREDNDGTTSARQKRVLYVLHLWRSQGGTWKDLAKYYNLHHGQASGVLSVLHKEGIIFRLKERRDKCAIYVLPEFVNGREVSARKIKSCPNCGWHS